MDLGQGLYVTVVGMGLVFFALAVLMVAITLLDRLFPYREPASENEEIPAAEGMPAAAAHAEAPSPTVSAEPASTAFEAVINDKRHRIEVLQTTSRPMLVIVDGQEYKVDQPGEGSPQIMVNGQLHSAKVVESGPEHVTVQVGNERFRVGLPRVATLPPAPVPVAVASPAPAPAPAAAAARPAPSAAPAASAPAPEPTSSGNGKAVTIAAPMPGKILKVCVAVGDRVTKGQEVCTIEAMKMENSIRAPQDGTVREIRTQAGQPVKVGQTLIVL